MLFFAAPFGDCSFKNKEREFFENKILVELDSEPLCLNY